MRSEPDDFEANVCFNGLADPRKWIRERLPELPYPLLPTYFGDGESPIKRDEYRIDNGSAFERYFSGPRKGLGFFADGFWMSFDLYSETSSRLTVFARARFAPHCRALLTELDAAGAEWGGAGMRNESASRNFLELELEYTPGGRATGWRGRDHARYVPGLYWLNYWSHEYIAARKLDPDAVVSALGGEITPLANGIILQLYDRCDDWTSKRQEVDDFLEASPAFFSMRQVDVPRLMTPKDVNKFLALHRKWP